MRVWHFNLTKKYDLVGGLFHYLMYYLLIIRWPGLYTFWTTLYAATAAGRERRGRWRRWRRTQCTWPQRTRPRAVGRARARRCAIPTSVSLCRSHAAGADAVRWSADRTEKPGRTEPSSSRHRTRPHPATAEPHIQHSCRTQNYLPSVLVKARWCTFDSFFLAGSGAREPVFNRGGEWVKVKKLLPCYRLTLRRYFFPD